MAQSQAISKSSINPSMVERIKVALTETHCFRGAQMNLQYLDLMSRRLAIEDIDRVLSALTALGERQRKDGETALLDLGTILAEMHSKPQILTRPEVGRGN